MVKERKRAILCYLALKVPYDLDVMSNVQRLTTARLNGRKLKLDGE